MVNYIHIYIHTYIIMYGITMFYVNDNSKCMYMYSTAQLKLDRTRVQ